MRTSRARRSLWVVLAVSLLGAALAASAYLVVAVVSINAYTSESTLLALPNDAAVSPVSGLRAQTGTQDPDRFVAAQISLLSSKDIRAQAARMTNSKELPTVSAAQGRLSDLISVHVTASSGGLAQKQAQALIATYLHRTEQDQLIVSGRVESGIQAELNVLRRELGSLSNVSDPGTVAQRAALADSYSALSGKLASVRADDSSKVGNAQVVSAPTPGARPGNLVRDAVLSGFAGLLLGGGVAIGIQWLRRDVFPLKELQEKCSTVLLLPGDLAAFPPLGLDGSGSLLDVILTESMLDHPRGCQFVVYGTGAKDTTSVVNEVADMTRTYLRDVSDVRTGAEAPCPGAALGVISLAHPGGLAAAFSATRYPVVALVVARDGLDRGIDIQTAVMAALALRVQVHLICINRDVSWPGQLVLGGSLPTYLSRAQSPSADPTLNEL